MTVKIALNPNQIQNLDLSSLETIIQDYQSRAAIAKLEQALQLEIDYPRAEGDMRELSEIPEVRLWFLRLDAVYPWLIFILDPKQGEIARYAAMLVPHQFHRGEG
ncbi:MAG: CRR6 family NdhI maturation factor, partial [Microcystis panniformis]